MPTIDEIIAHHLKESAESGELRRAKGYGEPLPPDPGWDETPETLRMPFKILKDAGVPPPEIQLFHERAALVAAIHASGTGEERLQLQRRLSELEAVIALRLEALRVHAKL